MYSRETCFFLKHFHTQLLYNSTLLSIIKLINKFIFYITNDKSLKLNFFFFLILPDTFWSEPFYVQFNNAEQWIIASRTMSNMNWYVLGLDHRDSCAIEGATEERSRYHHHALPSNKPCCETSNDLSFVVWEIVVVVKRCIF